MAFKWFKKKQKDQNGPIEDQPSDEAQKTSDAQLQADNEIADPLLEAMDTGTSKDSESELTVAETEPAGTPAPEEKKKKFFVRLKTGLSKTRDILNTDIEDLFRGGRKLDDEMMEELEELLITADIGVQTTMDVLKPISKQAFQIKGPDDLKSILKKEIVSIIAPFAPPPEVFDTKPHVIMVVGVNGVGKTTTVGKLAARYAAAGKKVLIGASDTFRAAAIEQLSIWAERAGAQIVRHKDKADPAAVAFDAVDAAVARDMDVVLIDTAGRLHTKVNLMEELKKIKRSAAKRLSGAPHETLLVLDATTGQNALSQAKLFNEALELDGLALTKLDGTAKGGIVVGICNTLKIPLKYIGVGEQLEDLQTFDPDRFAEALF